MPAGTLERRYVIDFHDHFADVLERLRPPQDDGLVRVEPDRITATTQGRPRLRNIAMCFDRHLPPADTVGAAPRFPRVIGTRKGRTRERHRIPAHRPQRARRRRR